MQGGDSELSSEWEMWRKYHREALKEAGYNEYTNKNNENAFEREANVNVVYKASVSKGEHVSTYIGSTQKFKERYNQHMLSFRNQAYRNSTSLPSYIWSLKESNVEYSVKWSIISKAKAYTPEQKRCHLCITEKAKILYCKDPNLINKRSEIMSKCRHRAKYKLSLLHT